MTFGEKYISTKAKVLLLAGGVTAPPVPVEDIARVAGVEIKYSPGLGKTYAVKYKERYIILLSSSGDEVADRVELAKKLGYLCLRHPQVLKETAVSRTGDFLDKKLEIFARELLIPDKFLLEALNTKLYVTCLQGLFKVPENIMFKKLRYTWRGQAF